VKLNFKQWLEETGAVTSNLTNTYEKDLFAKSVRSKYTPGPATLPKSEFDPDKKFGKKKKVVFKRSSPRKKYMKKKADKD